MLHTFLQEEFEDSTGNVVNKRIYDDLKRQGLLWAKQSKFYDINGWGKPMFIIN